MSVAALKPFTLAAIRPRAFRAMKPECLAAISDKQAWAASFDIAQNRSEGVREL